MGLLLIGLVVGAMIAFIWVSIAEYRTQKATEKWWAEQVKKIEKDSDDLVKSMRKKHDPSVPANKDILNLVDALDKLNKLNARLDKELGKV